MVVVLAVVVRLVLDPIALHYTRKLLAGGEGMKGAVDRVHVTLLPPGMEIARLKMIEEPGGRWDEPLFYAERTVARLEGRPLLHGHFVARARVEHPKIVIARQAKKKAEKGKSFAETLQEKSPVLIDRVEIVDGEILLAQGKGKDAPQLWVHDLEVAMENLATRKALMEGRPTTVAARAKVQRSGVATLFVSMDPLAKGLTFAGEAKLKDLAARDLYSFLAPKTDLQATQGTIDVFSEFKVEDGRITGGVKPVLKNIEVRSVDDGLFERLKGWFVDKAIDLASDRVPGRNAVATVVPIKGRIDNPDIQLVPAVLGIIRNAFEEALSSGFAHLPPPTAGKKEGILKQAKDALTKDKGPPDAQPEKGGNGRSSQGRSSGTGRR